MVGLPDLPPTTSLSGSYGTKCCMKQWLREQNIMVTLYSDANASCESLSHAGHQTVSKCWIIRAPFSYFSVNFSHCQEVTEFAVRGPPATDFEGGRNGCSSIQGALKTVFEASWSEAFTLARLYFRPVAQFNHGRNGSLSSLNPGLVKLLVVQV